MISGAPGRPVRPWAFGLFLLLPHSPAPTVPPAFSWPVAGNLHHGRETPARASRFAAEAKMSHSSSHLQLSLKRAARPHLIGPQMLCHLPLMGWVHFLDSSLPPSSRIKASSYVVLLRLLATCALLTGVWALREERMCPWSSALGSLGQNSSFLMPFPSLVFPAAQTGTLSTQR